MCDLTKTLSWVLRRLIVASSVSLLSPGLVLGAAEDSGPVRIGVLAKRGAERCLEKWGPTAEYLTAEIGGYSFVIRPLGHDEVGPAVQRGEVEFILTNPSSYVELERLYNVSRIVTLKNLHLGKAYTVYAAVIFRKSDSDDMRDLADLKDRTFMAVDEESFGGWQMAWRELKEDGIDPRRDFGDLRFGGTHDAVVYAVQEGKVDAGTVRADTLERMAMEGKIRLEDFQVIHEQHSARGDLPFPCSTRVYPEWPLAKAEHTPNGLAEKVAVALERMSPDSPAAQAARCAGWTIPHSYQSVHDCLKELRIGPYKDYGQVTGGAVVRQYWPWFVAVVGLLLVTCVVSTHVMRLNRKLQHALSEYAKELAEREQAERSLRKREQLHLESEKLAAVGRLAAGVAHEINNPLTTVLTFSHLLREKEGLGDQDKQDLDLIIQETSRASEIVRGLLDFARERPAHREALNVNEVVRRTIPLLGSQKAFQRIAVREHLQEDVPPVNADMNRLQQVLLNLSLNACEAMQEGGTLAISTSVQDRNVLLSVTDTGCGIKEEHLDHIFEPFFSTKPVGKGTGLGLSVSYGIVQRHGGTLEVESEIGKGTTFVITLPCAEGKISDSQDGEVEP
ncbi:MAG: PhnD/SsuA/transferrin family substrate-binding protein [Candidatus Nealsonbacteria bacterium]|nr:PhnD/SsuA/transferrin family substrate-binding protein [Candidatus Nealsonbacteria bacterium]